jgi:hypothetical protein
MNLLSGAHFPAMDSNALDREGHAPMDCFIMCRDKHCAVLRELSSVEAASWEALMSRLRRSSSRKPSDNQHVENTQGESGVMLPHNDLYAMAGNSNCEDIFVDAETGSPTYG